MATRRMTRLQTRNLKEQASAMEERRWPRENKFTKIAEMTSQQDARQPPSYSGAPGRRSFPLDHEGHEVMACHEKASKTDTTTKQKRTLAERVTNTFKNEKVVKMEVDYRHPSRDMDCSMASSRPSSPWVISTTSEDTLTGSDDRMGQADGGYEHEDDDDDRDDIDDQLAGNDSVFDAHCGPRDLKPEFAFGDTPLTSPATAPKKRPREDLPDGVADIDFDSDSLRTCEYACDILTHLLEKEKQWILAPNFLDKSPQVTPRMRAVLMDWLVQVQAHEELKEETLHLCAQAIDRYLSLVDTRMPKLQLVGITCLLIASKFVERFAPEISTLCRLTDHTFKAPQVLRYEVLILQKLDFGLLSPVCTTFLDRYLLVHEEEEPLQVALLARYLLDLSITSHHLAVVLPSLLAAGALYLARRLVFKSSHAWSPSLTYYTTYTEPDLIQVVNELANLLIKAPDSKYQGSRNKYNTQQYFYISNSEFTQRHNIVRMESREETAL